MSSVFVVFYDSGDSYYSVREFYAVFKNEADAQKCVESMDKDDRAWYDEIELR